MKRYASLIRKLVDATAEAETHGEDVADILKKRCFNDMSIVRQTLMNAVCDPRFKLFADYVGAWRDEARNALEQLADLLDETEPLTIENADIILDNFLSEWLKLLFAGQKNKTEVIPNYFIDEMMETDKIEAAVEFLQELEMDFDGSDDDENAGNIVFEKDEDDKEEEEMGDEDGGKSEYANQGDNKKSKEKGWGEGDDKDEDNEADDKNESREKEHLVPPPPSKKGRRPISGTKMQSLENRFFEKIPQSLVELARRIGRMGEAGYNNGGKFLKAGKSDIAGITDGNDMSAVLPSELALLAEHKTQNVFYHKYATRRLQLFASASQVKSLHKHQDGPVIICVDTSSSMTGEPIMVAKALAAAVAIIAWRKNRDVIMVKYSEGHSCEDFGRSASSLGKMSQFLSRVSMAGNNENSMFQWLFEEVIPTLPAYDTADILCVSDFGWTPLTKDTEEIIEKEKQKGMRFYGLNVNPYSDERWASVDEDFLPPVDCIENPMTVCDSLWVYEKGVCREVVKEEKR